MRLFVLNKKLLQFFQTKKLQTSKDFKRDKLHSSPFLFVRYFGSNELCNCYLHGPESNIVDFAIKLTASGVGTVRLAGHNRLYEPRDVALQLFVRNTENPFCFAIALTNPISSSCVVKTFFCSFFPDLQRLRG